MNMNDVVKGIVMVTLVQLVKTTINSIIIHNIVQIIYTSV